LAVPAALELIGDLVDGGWPATMARNHDLVVQAGRVLGAALRSEPSPDEMLGSMVALALPATGPLGGEASPDQSSPLEADRLQTLLYDRFAIEVPIYGWPVPAAEPPDPPRRLIRVSAALHNDRADMDRLISALGEISG
jgi:isopenicillin-N epimerase